ncbi:hypothetical protein N431DRAFT_465887 [Stipitochalara longipes BDJ]|nr:hypothetical protein N431DRAFT_465887 [Stipitochalara longipes BDJ]
MEHINYEAQFLTYVSHPSPPSYGQPEPFKRQSNASPEVVTPGSEKTRTATTGIPPPSATDQYYTPYKQDPTPRVVGGAVGGTLGKKHSSISPTACDNASECIPTPTSSSSIVPSASSTAAPSSANVSQIATGSFNNASTYIYLYFQDGSDIKYMTYLGTPLAATAYDAGDRTGTLTLFYLDSSNNVVQASQSNTKGSTMVSLSGSQSIQSGTNINPSSFLAAIYMDAQWGYRVYYQTTTGTIHELERQFTVAMISAPSLNVFYINYATNTLYFQAFTEANGGWGWSAATQLTSASISTWNRSPTVSRAAIAQTEPETLRIYYIGKDDEFLEFLCTTTDSWNCLSDSPDQSLAWTASDSTGPGAVGAIGWQNQVRFYYFHDGNMMQADLDGGTWTTMILPGA